MNPRDEWLAAAFRSRADDSYLRRDCPTPERIWDAVQLQLSIDERLEIIDHMSQCAACAEAWRLASELATAVVEAPSDQTFQSHLQIVRPRHAVKHWTVLLVVAPIVLVAIGISFTAIWSQKSEEAVPVLGPRDRVRGALSQNAREPAAIAIDNIRPLMKEVHAFLQKDDGAPEPRELMLACADGERTAIVQINQLMPQRIDDDSDRLYYVLNGDGIATVGGRVSMVTTGDTITAARGTPHGFQRNGRPLILVAVSIGEPCASP